MNGFQDDAFHDDDKGWNFHANPLDVNKTGLRDTYIDYKNTHDLQLLNILTVKANLGDYMSWLYGGPVGAGLYGLYNSYFYNH